MSKQRPSPYHTDNPNKQVPSPTTGTPQEHTNKNQSGTECKYKPMPEQKRVWGMTIFERIIAALTAVAILVAIFTGVILLLQWGEMKLDQRAWIVVRGMGVVGGRPTLNQPLGIQVFFLNTGKTPAKNVRLSCNFEVWDDESKVTFKEVPYETPFLLAPNDPNSMCTLQYDHPQPVQQSDLDDLKSRKKIIFVLGSVTYEDVFGKPHWLTFCRYLLPDGVTMQFCRRRPDDTGDGQYIQRRK